MSDKKSNLMYNGQINAWYKGREDSQGNVLNIYIRQSGLIFAEVGSENFMPEKSDLKRVEKQLKTLAKLLSLNPKDVKAVPYNGQMADVPSVSTTKKKANG